jgi:hypothetical protein
MKISIVGPDPRFYRKHIQKNLETKARRGWASKKPLFSKQGL